MNLTYNNKEKGFKDLLKRGPFINK